MIKQQLIKNQIVLRQLVQLFDNDKEPYDEKISKQQIKNKLKKQDQINIQPRWPFQLNNETHLVRLVEWISNGKDHLSRREFISKFKEILAPYPILQFNKDEVETVIQYLNNEKEKIESKSKNQQLNIIQLMEVIYSLMPEQYAGIYQYAILDFATDLDKINIKDCLLPIFKQKGRSKSTFEQKKSLEKLSPLRNLKYTPDYHLKKFANTAQISPVNFMDFYL